MRVISGKYRGKRLNSPQNNDVRPTTDKVKECIFNVIQWDIEGGRFLDLFAGTGSMGIEALSRGAKEAVFADCSKESIRLVNSNLNGLKDNYKVFNRDYRDVLYNVDGKWNFVFVDPPYKCDYIEEICRIVKDRDLLSDDGYIIYEHDKDKKDFVLPDGFVIKKQKLFGIIQVDFIQKSRGKTAIAGSYDPITKGHIDILDKALEDYDEVVILIAKNDEKTYLFSLDQRAEFARLATKDYLNVKVDICHGFVYEYCKNHGIDKVYRGYRDDKDLEYEKVMSDFNSQHGIETILVEGIRPVSSSIVREALKNGEDIKKYLPADCQKAVVRAYKECL